MYDSCKSTAGMLAVLINSWLCNIYLNFQAVSYLLLIIMIQSKTPNKNFISLKASTTAQYAVHHFISHLIRNLIFYNFACLYFAKVAQPNFKIDSQQLNNFSYLIAVSQLIYRYSVSGEFQNCFSLYQSYIHQQENQMIFMENIDSDSFDINSISSYHRLTSSFKDLSQIERFLDAKVFEKKVETQDSTQNTPQNIKLQTTQKARSHNRNHETEGPSSQKSIFHNFQKHLITLLRKVINIAIKSTSHNSQQLLAMLLWNAFKKVSSYNKQTFHMIFGVSNFNSFEDQLQKMALKYREFRSIWNRYSADQIFEAQGFIRKEVVQQMKQLNKDEVKGFCNVHKFETFYEYFQSFMLELQEGPISSRMSKTRKLKVLQKIISKPSANDL